ncbi:MAG: DUF1501 domain-containing protein [Saprospiraceae bacterium]|nr:DUF1501 domain-containing protein [Saprospiraceae bacterium]
MDELRLLQELNVRKLQMQTRRHFLQKCSTGLGALALGSFIGCSDSGKPLQGINPLSTKLPPAFAKAKRVIYLHMAGAPSQLELFDYKPELAKLDGQECPGSLLEGRRFAFIQGVPKMLGPQYSFKPYGQSGTYVSELLPHFSKNVDDACVIKSMFTHEFNHAPAQLFMHTGHGRLGRPSMGSWITYGLGTENQDLPGFIVLVSGGKTPDAGKSVWGSGFLPSVYQGVQCRSEGEPVLYLNDPKGMDRNLKGKLIEAINTINEEALDTYGDPETLTRIEQYELAFRMQVSVPEAMDITKEPASMHALYGTSPGESTFANNALLARRLAERGVRFIQLFHWGWDAHGAGREEALNMGFKDRCKEVDQSMSALLTDLKQRGMLDETLVVWGGEFGRTPMRENRDGKVMTWIGRDHHTECFSIWAAGGGIKGGIAYGETDELGYYGIKDKVHINDLHATLLHCMGIDHEKLTHSFQGRPFRLTDTGGKIIPGILA